MVAASKIFSTVCSGYLLRGMDSSFTNQWSVKRIAYTGGKVKEKGVEKKRRNKDVEKENSMV